MIQTTSPGWMIETSAQGWCTGKTQRDGMGREVGGGIRMGNNSNNNKNIYMPYLSSVYILNYLSTFQYLQMNIVPITLLFFSQGLKKYLRVIL